MYVTRSTAVTLAALIVCACPNVSLAAEQERLRQALQQLLEDEPASYHELLHSGYYIIVPLFIGADSAEVRKAMESHGYRVDRSWKSKAGVHQKYILKRRAFDFPSGRSADLHIAISAEHLPMALEGAGRVYAAHVRLVSEINARYSGDLIDSLYPRKSVFDVVLRSADVKDVRGRLKRTT